MTPDKSMQAELMALHAELREVTARYTTVEMEPAIIVFVTPGGAGVSSPLARDAVYRLLKLMVQAYESGEPPTHAVNTGPAQTS